MRVFPVVVYPRVGRPLYTDASALMSTSTSDELSSADARRRRPARTQSAHAFSSPGKSDHLALHTNRSGLPTTGCAAMKTKRRPPWGVNQLRDAWSEDAMTRNDHENLSERIHRSYRYHPQESQRLRIKYMAFFLSPVLLVSMSCSYYYYTGKPIWRADAQHMLNIIRVGDISPRSRLYLYRIPENDTLPEHVAAYREQRVGQRARAEARFRLTSSAFALDTENM